MRSWSSQLIFLIFIAASCLGQPAHGPLPHDPRPFGKYLVETCTLSGEQLTLRCTKVPYPADPVQRATKPCPRLHDAPCPTVLRHRKRTGRKVFRSSEQRRAAKPFRGCR